MITETTKFMASEIQKGTIVIDLRMIPYDDQFRERVKAFDSLPGDVMVCIESPLNGILLSKKHKTGSTRKI